MSIRPPSSPSISKGVDYYAYLDGATFTTEFTKPIDLGRSTARHSLNAQNVTQGANLQISESDIGLFSHTGRYTWSLSAAGDTIASKFAEIAPSTGDLGETTMGDMLHTPSTFGPNWACSYGFYDAGHGVGGLTDQDQSYVYATPDMSRWMGDLAQSMGAALQHAPFSAFALPGAHDAGMFDPTCVTRMVKNRTFLALLAAALGLPEPVVVAFAPPIILRAIINLSFTQKDVITTMLDLGVRYFDFRPGFCFDELELGIYHQHNFIPGYPYDRFVADVVTWLVGRPSEVVVVNLNFQGFNDKSSPSMKPTPEQVLGILEAGLAGSGLVLGTKADLGTSYHDVLAANKRLVVLPQIGSDVDATKYDSYSDRYVTTNVDVILEAIAAMRREDQPNYDYTVLQLQGTASGLPGGIFDSIVTASDASSPLMSTKPGFDLHTYPWLTQNVAQDLSAKSLIVFLNDFCDNALAATASAITAARVRSIA